MKLDVAVTEVVLSNVGTTGEFRIRNSAKAFKILSDGLYSNKIRAIIRELSCNALDSHVAAGKATVPFEVHLPSMLEPWFAVKDFGLGLDNNQVVNIYTTYFESTKTDSNEFIGALGLGSKSPFSYTDNFTITAIKDGIKRIYSAFINDVGVPSIAEMGEELTDEGNGVEVKFSVVDRSDYQSFRNEAFNVLKWFEHKPAITGVDNFKHGTIVYKDRDIVKGVHTRDGESDYYSRGSYAIMGNIPYPLNNIPDAEKHFGNLAGLLNCNLVLEFDIGELDFAASREQLSYIPLTLSSIKKKLELLNANLAIHVATNADAIKCEWARAAYLRTQSQSALFKSAVIKYVNDTKFELFDVISHYGRKDFSYTEPDLAARGLSFTAFRVLHGGGTNKIAPSHDYYRSAATPSAPAQYMTKWDIPVDMDVVIVLNDLKTGCNARARYHYSNCIRKSATVFCVSHNDADLTVRQIEYDKLLKELHNPPTVVKASTLEKKERVKPVSTQGIMEIGLKSDRSSGRHRRGYSDSYKWQPFADALDDSETYYYVMLSNHEPINDRGEPINVFKIQALMDECGIPAISEIKILGVRKNRIKELQELDNWVWFEDKLREETAKISDSHVASLVAAEMLDSYYNKVHTTAAVARLAGPDSPYAKYVKEYSGIKRSTGNVAQLVALCSAYGKAVEVENVKKKFEDAKTELYSTYPMLKYISSSAPDTAVAEYIKLVDNQRKENE